MDVLLCSVQYHEKHDIMSGRSTWENLGIGYLAAALSDLEGVKVTIHDNHFKSRSNDAAIELYKRTPKPDIVGVSMLAYNLGAGMDLIGRIKDATPDVRVVVGGFGPTFWKDRVLEVEPRIDAVFVGEGEVSFREYVRRLRDGEDWRETPGIYFKDNGELKETRMAKVPALDGLRLPVREARYPLNECTMSASRGCLYRCSFCSIVPFYQMQPGKNIRYRDPKLLVDEMEVLQKEHGVEWVNFTDDDFLGVNRISKGWSDRLAREMISRGIFMKMFFQTRADHVIVDDIAILKEAGLRTLAMGIESYNPRQLELYNKKVTPEVNREAVEILRRLKMNYEIYSIYVDADSKLDELQYNLKQFESLGYYDSNDPVPFTIQVNSFYAYPFRGSPLFERYQAEGRLTIEGFRISYEFSDPLMAALDRLCKKWNDRWNSLSDVILQYRYVPAIKLGKTREAIFYKRIHNAYFHLDSEWLMRVCDSLTANNGVNEAEIDAICDEIGPKLRELQEALVKHGTPQRYTYDMYGGFAQS